MRERALAGHQQNLKTTLRPMSKRCSIEVDEGASLTRSIIFLFYLKMYLESDSSLSLLRQDLMREYDVEGSR